MFDIVDVLAVREAVRRQTPLRRRICELLVAAHTHKEIADALGTKRQTVTEHVYRLRKALEDMGFGNDGAGG